MSQGIPQAELNPTLVRGLAFVAALGGLLFGYDTAVISGAVGAIDHNFIDPRGLSETSAASLSGWAISCALLGCVIGAALAGPMSQKIGRRGGLLVSAILFMLSSAGSAFPEFGFLWIGGKGPDALTAFILYRILGGVGIGVASMLSPLYIAEIAPPKQRGQLVTYQQVAIVVGMTLVYFVNWFIASQGDDQWVVSTGWRYMLLSAALPAALFFALLLLVPETPRWLVMKGRMDEARNVLARLTNEADARVVLKEIDESLHERTGKLFAFGTLVIFVGIMLSVFQQFIGINAVLYYAPLMFQNMGASTDSALLQTIIVGVANIVFTLVALVTVDRWGRKPLLILGGVVMAVSMLTLGFLFNSHNVGTAVLLAEIFPNPIKGKAMAIAVAMQWIANLFVSWSFKVLDGNSALNAMFNHGFSYWIYGVMSVLAALFVWRFVPETKGHSLEAIQHLWMAKPDGHPTNASSKASPANAL
jgi:SP family xylose:H+ symportor-like MFS transporter